LGREPGDRQPLKVMAEPCLSSCSISYFSSEEIEMPSQTSLTRRALLSTLLAVISAGCGSQVDIRAIPSEERGLKELGSIYSNFTTKKKRGPKTLTELNVKGQQFPIAVEMIKSGDLVVQWGAPLSRTGQAADTVLAYVKTAPQQGGYVLMQDGTTVKKMTADEFNAAPKAR
jgi:hypothetical protein